MRFRFAIVLAIVLAASAHSTFAQGTVMDWNINGVKRQALVFAPPPNPNIKGFNYPLVFAWHGHGGNMQGTSQLMHIQTLWKEAIVVYPQGLPTPTQIDPQGARPGWQREAGEQGDRDLKFFDAMLATLRQKFTVDDDRIYSTGFSNGSTFSYLLWAERAKVFAAFGICAGKLWPSEHLTEPRALIAIGGTNDHVVDFFTDQQQTIEAARQLDQATGAGQPCGPICTLYPSPIHTPVMKRIHSGGHVYPPWAAQAIVQFLKAHKHP
jgi:polyhydroxybutyrate depolymerase